MTVSVAALAYRHLCHFISLLIQYLDRDGPILTACASSLAIRTA
ncbi:MAG: hypothetical protein WCD87_21920 [Pseudolabrys sp.]